MTRLTYSRNCLWTTSNNKHFNGALRIVNDRELWILWNAPPSMFVMSGAAFRLSPPNCGFHDYCGVCKLNDLYNPAWGTILQIQASILKTNDYVWQQVIILAGRQELLLSTVKHRKLSRFSHVCRHDTLPKVILQEVKDGIRRRGRPRKSCRNNIKEWTGQSLSSLLQRRRQKSMCDHCNGGVCRCIRMTLGRNGC